MSETGEAMESAIYRGFVRHRRFTPVLHEFDNSVFMLCLKVSELPQVLSKFWQIGTGKLSWARFCRADYVGDENQSIEVSVKAKIAERLGSPEKDLDGEVYMLVHLRYLGFYFSPLNLYYLKTGDTFKYMLAEVSNTPWHEKHYYLVDLEKVTPHAKEFHVSPFNPMEQNYHWRIIPPQLEETKCLTRIQVNSKQHPSEKVFDATLSLDRVPLNQTELNRVLLKTPIQTLSIAAGIYWQALRLFLKGSPFYSHPRKTKSSTEEETV